MLAKFQILQKKQLRVSSNLKNYLLYKYYPKGKIDEKFLNVNFLNILDELNVEVVTKICLILLIFSNFCTNGTILKSSPTLEQ